MQTCWDELFGSDAQGELAFGRETRSDIVLKNRLRQALERFNTAVPTRIIQEAIDEICRDRSSMSRAGLSFVKSLNQRKYRS
ncbi:hypothetical protein L5M49_25025 [Shewanella sp. SM74]|nr:hypothetical protein [Shewanella sp. SM74]